MDPVNFTAYLSTLKRDRVYQYNPPKLLLSLAYENILQIIFYVAGDSLKNLLPLNQTCKFIYAITGGYFKERAKRKLQAFFFEMNEYNSMIIEEPINLYPLSRIDNFDTVTLSHEIKKWRPFIKYIFSKNLNLEIQNSQSFQVETKRIHLCLQRVFPQLLKSNFSAFQKRPPFKSLETEEFEHWYDHLLLILEEINLKVEDNENFIPLDCLINLLMEDDRRYSRHNFQCYKVMELLFKLGASPNQIKSYTSTFNLVFKIAGFANKRPFYKFITLFIKNGADIFHNAKPMRRYRHMSPFKFIEDSIPDYLKEVALIIRDNEKSPSPLIKRKMEIMSAL